MPPPPGGTLLAAGAAGAHRSVDPTTRRNLLAVGGVAVLAGQMAFSHLGGSTTTLLPDPATLVGLAPTESTITELTATALPATAPPVIEPLASPGDTLEPVGVTLDTAALHQTDAAQLAKAAGLAEAARAAEAVAASQAEQARIAEADTPHVRGRLCPPNTAGLAGVKSWVSTAGTELRCIFDVGTVGGIGSRPNASDHPRGLAVDFMTTPGVNGDQLADYALRYKDELKVKYVIWKQRINFGDGWHGMENRGSITANHFDHVHVSFRA